MSEQIDWSKAPEGASHYVIGWGFFKLDLAGWFICDDGEKVWRKTPYQSPENFSWWGNAVERPSPSWIGEGLPPVGVVCEVDWCEEWHKCEVIAHFQQRCGMVAAFTVEISDGAKSLDAFGADSFRPIRTPEQIAAERPTTPSWSGEGLPPVGVVCEVRNAPGGWGKATIKYQGKGIIVWLWDRPDGNTDQIEFASCPDRLEFRPIRTPEQIAADEREAAIKAIVGLIESADSRDMTIAEAIYNAGYRKEQK